MENTYTKKDNADLINALKQMQNEEWQDKKDKQMHRKRDNQTGCLWAAVITIIIVILFIIWFLDEFSWVT